MDVFAIIMIIVKSSFIEQKGNPPDTNTSGDGPPQYQSHLSKQKNELFIEHYIVPFYLSETVSTFLISYS